MKINDVEKLTKMSKKTIRFYFGSSQIMQSAAEVIAYVTVVKIK